MRRIHSVFAFLATLATPVVAQNGGLPAGTCGSDEALRDCYRRLNGSAGEISASIPERVSTIADLPIELQPKASELLRETKELVENAADKRVTPTQAPGAAGALTDVLPKFLVSGGLQGLEQTDDGYTFGKIFELGESLRLEIGADIFPDADLFAPLQEKLPKDLNEEVLAALKEPIGDFDKTDFEIKLSWENGEGDNRFGRDFDEYVDLVDGWVANRHAELHRNRPTTPLETWAFSDEVSLVEEALDGSSILSLTPAELRITHGISAEEVDIVVASLVEAATGMETFRASIETPISLLTEEAVKQLSEAVTNQPQIFLNAVYRERQDLTGPSEWSVQGRYEMGLSGNVNDYLAWRSKPDNTCQDPESFSCFQAWRDGQSAAGLRESAAIDRGHRLTIELAYTDTDSMRFDLTDQDIPLSDFTFALDRTQKWSASLAYGINLDGVQFPNVLGLLSPLGGGNPPAVAVDATRLDIEAKYDDVTGDPIRQSRLTATATLSQKMAEKTILSIGVAWAEKPEYLGEVDEKTSANLGLRWSFYGADDSKKKGDGDGNGG